MRDRFRACLLCRHAIKPLHTPELIRSFVSSARQRQDYVLTPLIIELDAADSKYVRRFEELDDEEKRTMFGSEYLNQNIQDLNPPADTDRTKLPSPQRTSKSGLNTRIVTPPDIMSYVLFGESKSQVKLPFLAIPLRRKHLRLIYHDKGVQPFNSIEHNAQNLLYKFKRSNIGALQHAGFRPDQEAKIASELKRRKNFADLSRRTSMISQTGRGRALLAQHGSSIVEGIKFCRRQNGSISTSDEKYTRLEDVLCHLNDLHANLSSQNRINPVDIGPHICYAGLYYASKAFNLPAVRMYLQIATEKSYAMTPLGHWAMVHFCASMEKVDYPAYQKSWNAWRSDDWRKTERLRLLTGWNSGGMPAKGETRQPCFANLIADCESSYKQYVLCLGKLGAADALWHEWENPTRSQKQSKESSRERAETIVAALLVAKDRSRALLVRDSFQASLASTSLKEYPDSPNGFLGIGVTTALSQSMRVELVDEFLKELEIEPSYVAPENLTGPEVGRKSGAATGG